jgi:hypothetical protein
MISIHLGSRFTTRRKSRQRKVDHLVERWLAVVSRSVTALVKAAAWL